LKKDFNLFNLFLLLCLLLVMLQLVGLVGFFSAFSNYSSSIYSSYFVIDFPTPVGNLANSIPVKIKIPNPQAFGYPRVPVALYVAFSSYRFQGIYVPLTALPLPPKFLETPIEKVIDFPLPTKKRGSYRIVVDVKCLYGPSYSRSSWYSFTYNLPIEIVSERAHIIEGPVENGKIGYTLSQAAVYDFLQKGYSYRIQIDVVSDEILYTEDAASVETFFDPPTPLEIQNEIEETEKSYQFLLEQFPGATLEISFVPTGTGDWRWLFSTQPIRWIEKNGIVIATNDPNWSWNPYGEFQLEYIGD